MAIKSLTCRVHAATPRVSTPFYLNTTDVAHVIGLTGNRWRKSRRQILFKTVFGVDTDDETAILRKIFGANPDDDGAYYTREGDCSDKDASTLVDKTSFDAIAKLSLVRQRAAGVSLDLSDDMSPLPVRAQPGGGSPEAGGGSPALQKHLMVMCGDAIKATNTTACNSAKESLYRSIDDLKMSMRDTETIKTMCRDNINAQRGIVHEDSNLSGYERDIDRSLSYKNDKMRYCTLGGFRIGGKVDGFDETRREVVEVKTRQNGFMGVRPYEKCQLEIYMLIFGTSKSRLVECYGSERREYVYNRDPTMLANITTGLASYRAEIFDIRDGIDDRLRAMIRAQ